ncbi:hypothetical protein N7475_005096 [Penicillium sp. IBT 31633x]|nr:hypothetical protein N7475_005096 [Penicillium sp. IBT 31633x]
MVSGRLQPLNPFDLPSSVMRRRASDRCPYLVGSERLVDPADDTALWVTVEFDPVMKYTHDDERLIEFVIAQIQDSHATISAYAQHYHEPRCLSLPVTGYSSPEGNERAILAKAHDLATWWLAEIVAGEVRLDRNVIFSQYLQEVVFTD